MHPMRCDRGYVYPPPRREGAGRQFRRQGLDAPVRAIPVPPNLLPTGRLPPPPRREGAGRQFRRQGLDAPVRAIPVPLNLVPTGRLAPEAAKTDRLGPTDLHQQAVFDIEMGRSDRAWRGDEDEPHPVAHLALPAEHPALELIERRVHQFGVRGIIFDVEQRKPGVGVLYVADNVTWPGQRAPRRASLGNQERLSSSVIDHRLTGQAVSQVGNGLEGQPSVFMKTVDELRRLLREGST